MTTVRRRLSLLAIGLSLCAKADAAPDAAPARLSMAAYRATLDRLSGVLSSNDQAGPQWTAVVGDLPPAWYVQAGERTYEIATAPLAEDLRLWWSRGDRSARQRAANRLRTLGAEAGDYERPVEDRSASRARLEDILSGKDYRNVHGPTWLDALRQRILEWIARLLTRVVGSSAIPTVANVFVYAVVATAVVVLAWWALGLFRREKAAQEAPPDPVRDLEREWPSWLADAQSAASGGRWREGVHFAFWCAIAFLESTGAWSPDRTRTPREYARLVSESSEPGSSLAVLTRLFERVWYGTEAADAQSFAQAMDRLKSIGCPPA
jgi:hypothetical protein